MIAIDELDLLPDEIRRRRREARDAACKAREAVAEAQQQLEDDSILAEDLLPERERWQYQDRAKRRREARQAAREAQERATAAKRQKAHERATGLHLVVDRSKSGCDPRQPEQAIPDGIAEHGDLRRQQRHVRRAVMRSLEPGREPKEPGGKPRRTLRASCGRPISFEPTNEYEADKGPPAIDRVAGKYHLRNVIHCRSIWACAVCAAKVRSIRGQEVDAIVRAFEEPEPAWRRAPGAVLTEAEAKRRYFPEGEAFLVTLTLRHARADGLRKTIDALFDAWRQGVCNGRRYGQLKQRYGIVGWMRSVEIQAAGPNGWHPHIHAVMFCDRPLSETDRKAMEGDIYDQWSNRLAKHELRAPSRARGVRVDRIARGSGGAAYVAKVEAVEGMPKKVGMEMTRHDLKTGREGSLVPFEILDRYAEARRVADVAAADQWAAMWREYVEATHRRQCMHVSKDLREILGLGAKPPEDEQLDLGPDAIHDGDPDELPDGPVMEFPGYAWVALQVACGHRGEPILYDLLEAQRFDDAERFASDALVRYEARHDDSSYSPVYYVDDEGRCWRLQRRLSGHVSVEEVDEPPSSVDPYRVGASSHVLRKVGHSELKELDELAPAGWLAP